MAKVKIKYKHRLIKTIYFISISLLVSACVGPRINKKNVNLDSTVFPTIAQSSDGRVKVTLNKILVKNSPGSWAKDAKWDEYIFHIENLTDTEIKIKNIMIYDALNDNTSPLTTRKHLNQATSLTKSKFKKSGIKIKWGAGSTNILAESITATAIGSGVAAGVAGTGAVTTGAGTLTAAGGAVFIAVPAIAIGGIMKLVNNSKISKQIKKRQTSLPYIIYGKQTPIIDLFYSGIPGPQKIKVIYTFANKDYNLIFKFGENLNTLHFKPIKK